MSVEVLYRQHPLKHTMERAEVPIGLTIGQIVRRLTIGANEWDVRLLRGDQDWPVHPEHFDRVYPKPGTIVVVQPRTRASALFSAGVSALVAAGMTQVGATLAVAAVSVALSAAVLLLTNHMFGADADPNNRGDKSSPVLRGLQNIYPSTGSPVPIVLGRHRMAAVKSAIGYSELIGQRIWRRERMTWGVGPVALESLKIGTTAISEFKGVSLQFRNVDQARTLAAIPALADMNVEWLDDGDEMTLYSTDIFEDQESARLDYNDRVTRTTPGDTIRAKVVFYFGGLVRLTNENKKKAIRRQIGVYYRPAGSSDPWVTVSENWYRGRTTAVKRFAVDIEFPSTGEWDVSLVRISKDSDDDQLKDDSYLEALQSEAAGALPSPSGVAEVSMRIRSTDQLNGTLDPVNAVVQQLAPVWNGLEFGDPEPVRHPSDIYTQLLRGPMRKRAVPDEKIDLAGNLAWKTAWPDWTCDMVLTEDIQLGQLVRQVLACGLAAPKMVDGKYGVLVDRSREPAEQVFTTRNVSGMQATWTPAPEIHGLKIRFTSEHADWEDDEVITYANGYDEETATEIETLEPPGAVVAEGQGISNVARFAYFHLAQLQNRTTELSFSTELEHIVCSRGSPVICVHDMLRNRYGEGRLTSVVTAGSEISELQLDSSIDLTDGTEVFIAIRGSERVIQHVRATKAGSSWLVEAGSGARDFPAGVFSAADVEVGDLAVVYEVETEAQKWLVKDIAPDYGERARLTLVEATEVPLDDLDRPLPTYDARVFVANELQNLRGSVEYENGQMFAVVNWSVLDPADRLTFRVVMEGSDGELLGQSETSDLYARFPVQDSYADILSATVWARTRSGSWGPSSSLNFSTADQFSAPAAVENFNSRVIGDTIMLSWDTGASNIDYYVIRYSPATSGASWASSVPIVPKARGEQVAVAAQNGTYLIKAVTVQGSEALSAVLTVVTSVGAAVNIVETLQVDPSFAGVLDDGLGVIDGELWFFGADDLLEIDDLLEVSDLLVFGRSTMSATYEVDGQVDLGAVDTAKVAVALEALAFFNDFEIKDVDDLLLVPDLLGGADGQWSITPQVSTTDDDPAGSPVWSAWSDLVVSDYRARAFRFRLLIDVLDAQLLVKVSALGFIVDQLDRILSGGDVVCEVAGEAITFDPPYRTLRTISVNPQSLETGDYFVVSGKSKSGFTVQFFDNTDSPIERTFDWIAVGHGKEGI